jgi:hypothetical protein
LFGLALHAVVFVRLDHAAALASCPFAFWVLAFWVPVSRTTGIGAELPMPGQALDACSCPEPDLASGWDQSRSNKKAGVRFAIRRDCFT